MYNADGKVVWSAELDAYGDVRELTGERTDCPFRYQGQYEDRETGLYYNRFRYYSAEEGMYISQDPIGLEGGEHLYSYVKDTNSYIDTFGLSPSCAQLDKMAKEAHSRMKDGRHKNSTTVAVGVDSSGKIYISTNHPYTPRKIKKWAEENNATVVNSKKRNVHAEESVFNNSPKKPTKIGSIRLICADCQACMKDNGIEYDTDNITKRQSKRRASDPSLGNGQWDEDKTIRGKT